MNLEFNLPHNMKLPTLREARKFNKDLHNKARVYGAMNIRSNHPMKYLLSKVIPVHFTATYSEMMGINGKNYEVERTAKWWAWRDNIYRHFVSV